MPVTKILFVCLGNICRSPTAEGVFRNLLEARELTSRFEIDSAGTGDWHIGKPPDNRAQAAAAKRGVDITDLRARQIADDDAAKFDYLVAMDNANFADLQRLVGDEYQHKIRLLRDDEIPDPYYGGDAGFNQALDLIEQSCAELLDYLITESARKK